MKHITILATPGINIGSIDNPRRAFLSVNEYLVGLGESPVFSVNIAGSSKEIVLDNGLCTIHADMLITDLDKTDLIIIPAFEGDLQRALKKSSPFIPWMINQYNGGAEIASLCIGAFLLAASGLLNGKNCSTHWRAENEFKKLFPEVQLVTEKVITDERGIYTSGGAFSSANLILYLIEKFAGREAAIYCAKMFQVDIDRHTQSPFIIFEGQKDHQDETVKKAQEFIENNYQERISVDQLTNMLALSRRNFERRFKKATANTAMEYIQRVKIEAAKKFFEVTHKNINEVMYDVGYSDVKAFRNIFRRITGLSPIEYRNKYNRELVME
jgi:transcriptional regulator GlxA family with amidase domain